MPSETNIFPIADISIPGQDGSQVTISIIPGYVIFLVGQNGTGKSALMHFLKARLGDSAIYMPGSRPSYFDADSLSINPSSRRALGANLRNWDSSPETRWKSISGTARNEKAVHDLQAAEIQYGVNATNDIKQHGKDSLAINRLLLKSSPLDEVNELLEQANLPVRLVIENAELKAFRQGAAYSFAKMSDGERTSLIFAAEVVSAPPGSVFVVDEPELHLHRSIIVPLLRSLIKMRKDCSFIVSTHELALPGETPQASALLVRGCKWNNDYVVSWLLDVIPKLDFLPESLMVDILGARKKILFIEGVGTGHSLDYPLYALLFPSVSVINRETCKEVHRAVAGTRSVEQYHHAKAYGMVDQDGMDAARSEELKGDGVYALPIFAVESIYYSHDVLEAVAAQQALNLGETASELLNEAKRHALLSIKEENLIHLASRVAERRMRDQLQSLFPSREEMIDAGEKVIPIAVSSPFPNELQKIRNLVSANDLQSVIRYYPIRESGILPALAKGLRFIGRPDYEKAALARIAESEELKDKLRTLLGEVSKELQ